MIHILTNECDGNLHGLDEGKKFFFVTLSRRLIERTNAWRKIEKKYVTS